MSEEDPKYITDFMEALYPGCTNLAMAAFKLENVLNFATELIATLKARNKELEEEKEEVKINLKIMTCHCKNVGTYECNGCQALVKVNKAIKELEELG